MIRARMNWAQLRMEVSGHAGFAEPGKDIVCAGVSMLVQAMAGALEDAEKRGRTVAGYREKDGTVTVWADPNADCIGEVKAYFKMCVKGIRMIAEEYPKNVEIKEV